MTDVSEGSASAGPNSLPSLRTLHKVTALAACAWLTVLGLTGWALDHHEWRWTHQLTVPEAWTSAAINRLVRGTIIRKIEGDRSSPDRFLAGSERGLWLTEDRGRNWRSVVWIDADGRSTTESPQVYDLVSGSGGDLHGAWVATDDGIWRVTEDGKSVRRFALPGAQVSSLAAGASPDELLGVVAETSLIRLSTTSPEAITQIDMTRVPVTGLPDQVNMGRFIFDLHVGRGFLPQPWSTAVNDYGGISIAVLSISGLMFWWLPRRWGRTANKPPLKARQRILRWLFRSHGPVIGLLAIIPITYLSLTGFAADHIVSFLEATKCIAVARDQLPPLYAYRNLSREVSSVAAFPGVPQRLMISSRFGALLSEDGGRNWAVDKTLPQRSDGTDAGRMNIFRRGGLLFAGIGGVGQFVRQSDQAPWTELVLPGNTLAITDAIVRDDVVIVKNSRAIYSGKLSGEGEKVSLAESGIAFPALTGTTFFLFLGDIHSGHIIHSQFGWVNDAAALAALILALSGPVLWWRRKWM